MCVHLVVSVLCVFSEAQNKSVNVCWLHHTGPLCLALYHKTAGSLIRNSVCNRTFRSPADTLDSHNLQILIISVDIVQEYWDCLKRWQVTWKIVSDSVAQCLTLFLSRSQYHPHEAACRLKHTSIVLWPSTVTGTTRWICRVFIYCDI